MPSPAASTTRSALKVSLPERTRKPDRSESILSIFLADLLRATPGEVRYHFVDVVREGGAEDRPLDINFITHFEMKDRPVYLLKDIVTTGVIENYLVTQFRQRKPSELKLVALLDRPSARRVLLPVDYRAFEVETGTFVGYGLEHEGRFENLPFIGTLQS